MKILVTGAAGFIGSNLSSYLLSKGHEVAGLDNFDDYYPPKIKEYNIREFKDDSSFTLHRVDLLDVSALMQVFDHHGSFDGVVHLAAWAGVTRSFEEPVSYVRQNIEATVNLIEKMLEFNSKNILFASTSSIYGSNNPVPFKEDMTTDHPLAPYPATKKADEVMLSSYSQNYDLNVSIFRIFNPVGLRLRPDLALPKLIRSALYGDEFPMYWADPTSTSRDYTYIIHMFEAFEKALNNPFKYETFNLGNSQPINLKEFIETVERVVGKQCNIVQKEERKGEMISTYADITKAQEMLDYNPKTSLEEMIKIYYDWFTVQEDWYKKGELYE